MWAIEQFIPASINGIEAAEVLTMYSDCDRPSFLFNSPTSSKKGDAHGIGLTGDMGEGLVKYLFFGDIRCAYVGP